MSTFSKKLIFIGLLITLFAFGGQKLVKSFSKKEIPEPNNSFYVAVNDNGLEFKIPAVKGTTVQNILASSNIKLSRSDLLLPNLDFVISPGSKIIIQRAVLVKIIFDGQEKETAIFGSTVEDALSENKIELAGLDKVKPGLKEPICSGIEIKIIRVTQKIIPEKFEINYQTIEKLNDQMFYGKTRSIQKGKNGEEIKTFKVTYENGKEVKRELISREVIKESLEEIIEKGVKIVIGRVQIGVASWYDYKLDGIVWSKNHLTAASRDFQKRTFLRVTNLANNKSVIVKVNDYVVNPKVIIDLSSGAFKKIASLWMGKIEVKVEEIL